MRILITGAGGQLARELLLSAPQDSASVALARQELDITDRHAIATALQRHKPAAVINAAAYTAVDRAEAEPESAQRINGVAPGLLADACSERGIRLLHLSTDFVFAGNASTPYAIDAEPAPLGAYARSKLAGERAVADAGGDSLILRTGWVYSRHGGNFVLTMLRLMNERDELGVVADQVGTPTWARGLALALWAFVARPQLSGIYHWSDAGVCSWYDFAVAIAEEGHAMGLLPSLPRILPIATEDYPTPAQRPAYSVLDKRRSWQALGMEGVHWRRQLRMMLQDMQEFGSG